MNKKNLNQRGVYFHDSNSDVIWNVGIYIRLSVADGNEVSLSVENQEAIIKYFLDEEFSDAYRIYKIYIDDGFSGTTDDERFAFQEMISDINKGYVNCVISKMLSRVFRNYADQGYYLEEFFPRMGIRFITLESPRIDTYINPGAVSGYEVPLNGIVNDRFAESTSKAVRQTFQNMRREGKFQGGFPPYGYIRDPQNKYHFIIDDEAAEIVKRIYHMYVVEHMGIESIRRTLNEQGIINPTGYKISKGFKYCNPRVQDKTSLGWSQRTVKSILQNRTYIGDMVQGKYTVISYKVHKQIQVPLEQWDIVPGAHEAIIDMDMFNNAQELLKLNKNLRSYNSTPSMLSGFVYCADCGRKMHKRKNGTREYYACSTYYKRNKNDCTSHFTKAEIIAEAVLKAIQMQISLIDFDNVVDNVSDANKNNYYDRQKKLYDNKAKELERVEQSIERLYFDYNKRILSSDEYLKFKKRFLEQKRIIEDCMTELLNNLNDNEKRKAEMDKWKELFKKHRNIVELDRVVLETFVDRIYVDQDKNITIHFKYGDLFADV